MILGNSQILLGAHKTDISVLFVKGLKTHSLHTSRPMDHDGYFLCYIQVVFSGEYP